MDTNPSPHRIVESGWSESFPHLRHDKDLCLLGDLSVVQDPGNSDMFEYNASLSHIARLDGCCASTIQPIHSTIQIYDTCLLREDRDASRMPNSNQHYYRTESRIAAFNGISILKGVGITAFYCNISTNGYPVQSYYWQRMRPGLSMIRISRLRTMADIKRSAYLNH